MNKDVICTLKVLSDSNRIKIIELISKKEYCACDLLNELNISQSTLSYHMKALEQCGLVKVRKVNKWSYYTLNKKIIDQTINALHKLVK